MKNNLYYLVLSFLIMALVGYKKKQNLPCSITFKEAIDRCYLSYSIWKKLSTETDLTRITISLDGSNPKSPQLIIFILTKPDVYQQGGVTEYFNQAMPYIGCYEHNSDFVVFENVSQVVVGKKYSN